MYAKGQRVHSAYETSFKARGDLLGLNISDWVPVFWGEFSPKCIALCSDYILITHAGLHVLLRVESRIKPRWTAWLGDGFKIFQSTIITLYNIWNI